jgi:hypothetical protein
MAAVYLGALATGSPTEKKEEPLCFKGLKKTLLASRWERTVKNTQQKICCDGTGLFRALYVFTEFCVF